MIIEDIIIIIDDNKSYNCGLVSNNNPCENCSNNIANGGSGVCNCTLGSPVIY